MSMNIGTLAAAKAYANKAIHKAELDDIELDKSLTKSNFAADAVAVSPWDISSGNIADSIFANALFSFWFLKDTHDIRTLKSVIITNRKIHTIDPKYLPNNDLPMPTEAAVGQYFRVKAVDKNGKITEVEAVDPSTEILIPCLYNGIRLPRLPAWNQQAYPYAFIYGSSQSADLVFAKSVDISENYLNLSGHEYVTYTTQYYSDWCRVEKNLYLGILLSAIKWASFDVINSEGEVILLGSNPVPAYEEAVLFGEQYLTSDQQEQARNNIGAATLSELEAKLFPLIEIKTKLKLNETVMLSEAESELLEGVDASFRLPRLAFAIDDLGGCITIPTAIDQVFLVTIIVGADIITIIFDNPTEDLWSATASVFSMAPTE